MKIKKILFVLPSLRVGGMERVASIFANNISKYSDVRVSFLLFGKNVKVDFEIEETIEVRKFSEYDKKLPNYADAINYSLFVRNSVKKIKPDIIVSFGTRWNKLILFSLIGLSQKVYISDRGNPVKKRGLIQETVAKILYPRATGVIAQTSIAKRVMESRYGCNKVKVIGNPIRTILTKKNNQKKNEVITVGRLIESKHHDRLIKIFSEIRKEGWILRIIGGDVPQKNNMRKLQAIIEELHLESYVILEGEKVDVDQFYQQAKIFAFTSSSEGFPNVIGEALTAGLPVISYDCNAGPSDMIRDGENGFLVPLFNDQFFKNRLQLLMDNNVLRKEMGNTAAKSMKNYSPHVISNKFYSFITSHL